MHPQVAWEPTRDVIERAQLSRFLRFYGADSFEDCYRRSIDDVEGFTESVLRFLDLRFQRWPSRILDLSRGPEWPAWCVDGELNIAESCLKHAAERTAVIHEDEEGKVRQLTYGQLRTQVRSVAAGLRRLGLKRGEAVAIHLPMSPDTVVVLLATALIGAVAVPLFSGYGTGAIESRVGDANASILITFDEVLRRGSRVKSAALEASCPSVKKLVVVSRDRGLPTELLPDSDEDAVAGTGAEDPLIVLYTSGTTGRPKGISHTHCGFPVKSAQDMCFGTDVGAGTRICWITDIGWMMGPWLIYGATILGATLVLYEGAPDYPDSGRLWRFAAAHKVEVLGISPTLIRSLAASDDKPSRHADLTALRLFASTGEPWNPEPWWWLFERVGGGTRPIINYSGGTEISGGILMGNPLLPVKPCSFPAPCPGIAADIVDDRGAPVPAGAVGELVIRQPWIGQARGFLNAPERYIETYWSRWPGIWAHGDWAMRDDDAHWYILGRSDDTLKIAGKRVGPAEVESILVSHGEVAEAAVIGVPHPVKGETMAAFCVRAEKNIKLAEQGAVRPAGTRDVAEELRQLVGTELGKPLRPDIIHFVPAIPKTRNGKVMRRVIRAVYLGQEAGDISALENPSSVEAIRQAKESRPDKSQP